MTRTRGTGGARPQQGRSTLLPIFVGVIAVSAIVIFYVVRGALADEDGLPDVPADPAVTAFWVEQAGPLLHESRTFAPDRVQHVNDAQACRPSEEVQGLNCDELPDLYRSYARAYERFAEKARTFEPPPGVASEWWAKQIEAWEAFAGDFEAYREMALAGYQDEEWAEVSANRRGPELQSEAELLLAEMLPYVEESVRLDPVSVNP